MKLLICLLSCMAFSAFAELSIEEFANLRGLEPSEREFLEKKFIEYNKLPPKRKEKLEKKWKKLQNLPEDKRMMIKELYSSPEKRQRIRKRLKKRRLRRQGY